MNPLATKITAYIADDSELLRLALRQVLTENGVEVVGEAADADTAIAEIARLEPSVVLIQAALPKLDACKSIKHIKKVSPATAVLFLLSEPEQFFDSIVVGADGYLVRETQCYILPIAARSVASGQGWIGPSISKYLLQGEGRAHMYVIPPKAYNGNATVLTPKERAVIALVAEGMTNKRVAQQLGVSIETVRVHMKHILKKLQATNRMEAVERVLRHAKN